MSLWRHLVKADFRQFRSALAIWCGLVVTSAAIHGVRPMLAAQSRPFEMLGLLAVLVWTGGLLVMLGFIAQAVQAHPLVGTTAFWMTRPIPPRTLLGAKLVFLGIVMVLVPVFAEMALMAVSAGGGQHMRWARNGSELFFIAADQRLTSVRVTVGATGKLVLGTPVPLFRTEFDSSFMSRQQYVVSPDGPVPDQRCD